MMNNQACWCQLQNPNRLLMLSLAAAPQIDLQVGCMDICRAAAGDDLLGLECQVAPLPPIPQNNWMNCGLEGINA